VRIIAATHRNLEEMIIEGKFREDLYYRLNVFPIEAPALRERAQDIPLLLQELVTRLENNKQHPVRFTQTAMTSLMRHRWPGNVRELSNLVERLSILHPSQVVDVRHLPLKYQFDENGQHSPEVIDKDGPLHEQQEREAISALFQYEGSSPIVAEPGADPQTVDTNLPADGVNLKEYLSDLEINLIKQALEQQDWVVARAADQLGMRRTTLVEKMRKYEIFRLEKADGQ
jgi:sigma-54 specific flagellar transcriptional regulator A